MARGPNVVTLTWPATGDDGTVGGDANDYDLRYQPGDTIDFAAATRLRDVWTPESSGSSDRYTLAGLSPGSDYTFGLVVVDNVGNSSPVAELTVTTLGPIIPPPTVLYADDHFDDNYCGNWYLEGAWGCESDSLSDSPGVDYSANHRASATLPFLHFEAAHTVQVSFDLVACDLEPDRDYLYFQYSIGSDLNQKSWRTLDRYTGTSTGPRFYDLSMLAGSPTSGSASWPRPTTRSTMMESGSTTSRSSSRKPRPAVSTPTATT